jgi:hypothetical protein
VLRAGAADKNFWERGRLINPVILHLDSSGFDVCNDCIKNFCKKKNASVFCNTAKIMSESSNSDVEEEKMDVSEVFPIIKVYPVLVMFSKIIGTR